MLMNISEYAEYCLFLYRFWSKGHLFQPGGIMDQPAAYLAAMDTIERAVISLAPDQDGAK